MDIQWPLEYIGLAMRAQLKEIMSSDIDVWSYYPEESDNFCIYVAATIGIEGSEGGDIFQFQICSPRWLKSAHDVSDVIFCRHVIIAFYYDFKRFRNEIAKYCERTSGKNWDEVSEKISRIGWWEFEDLGGPGDGIYN